MKPTLLAQNRTKAEEILKRNFGFEHFHDEQWEAISLLLRGNRVLMIERTGFGKSLCFQYPALLFSGLTIIFSPLIALMRDQVKSLRSRGIAAGCINCEQESEENERVLEDARKGRLKLLYIAPERQENRNWMQAIKHLDISMLVIDEAHTISVWGHDFRPNFRRIVNVVRLLPAGTPVLAVTATATKRVQEDIESQIGNDFITIRGTLTRPNLNLYVIRVHSEEEKLAWITDNISRLPGTGLIYTGTRVSTDTLAAWLQFNDIDAIAYNAGLDPSSRKDIEQGFMSNRWKCIVTTNALGMGIDKPDIRFIIHTQIPASLIHYYQEIGRAGRDGSPANIILFYNDTPDENGVPADCHLPLAFIEGARPAVRYYHKVIESLKEDILGEKELLKITNLKVNALRTIKADLIDQGIVRPVKYGNRTMLEYQLNAPELDSSDFERMRKIRLVELDKMKEYVSTDQPRMKFLCEYLGDPVGENFANCDNTALQRQVVVIDRKMEDRLNSFEESIFPELQVSTASSVLTDGIAAAYYGQTNVGAAIHRSKYENGGDFPDFIIKRTLKAFRKKFGKEKIDVIMYVPPSVSGDLVKNFAGRLASTLRLPLSHAIHKTRETDLQKKFHSSITKGENVHNAFAVRDYDVTGKTVLLIDDIFDSGHTIKEIGRLLTRHKAAKVLPLVIAKTVGNDNI